MNSDAIKWFDNKEDQYKRRDKKPLEINAHIDTLKKLTIKEIRDLTKSHLTKNKTPEGLKKPFFSFRNEVLE